MNSTGAAQKILRSLVTVVKSFLNLVHAILYTAFDSCGDFLKCPPEGRRGEVGNVR